jgi:hypothetical protein
MKLRLNYWQLILLYAPFWVLVFSSLMPLYLREKYHLDLKVFTAIIAIDLFLAVGYQACLVILFNIRLKGTKWMIVHTVIPVIFAAVCVMATIAFMVHGSENHKLLSGPVQRSKASSTSGILSIFMLHMLVTFFVINNLYVSGKIAKIKNISLRENLAAEFGEPLKKIFIVSLLTIAGSLLLAVVLGIIRAKYFNS